MPEGDTIHDAAACLSEGLAGRTVARFATSVVGVAQARLVGRRVDRVTARGKWLSIHFDDGRVLRSHMRMTGAWHLYRRGEAWRRPEHTARVILAVEGEPALVAVCFSAPVIRLTTRGEDAESAARLGPDVVDAAFDAGHAVARLRALGGDRAVGEALLDQRALAGIGNIYKSETLFAERVSPFTPVAQLDDATITRLVLRAHTLMRRNLGGPGRSTTSSFASSRYAVYLRARRPCPRCGYPIARAAQGLPRRSTYYCPRCQRALGGDATS